MSLNRHAQHLLEEALARTGQRSTRQRELVFEVLLSRRDHPTADEVYARSREKLPGISLATVYNCLEALVGTGLVRAVNIEREPTRYCPNLARHAHFHDRKTGRVYDIDLPEDVLARLTTILPDGFRAEEIELSFHGTQDPDQPRG